METIENLHVLFTRTTVFFWVFFHFVVTIIHSLPVRIICPIDILITGVQSPAYQDEWSRPPCNVHWSEKALTLLLSLIYHDFIL